MNAAMNARGRFITLEGGEGAGKSVQVKRLEARLKEIGVPTLCTREPGGSPHAEILREAILSGFLAPYGPEAEALVFAAARIDHVDETIAPALEKGTWVISDRFADSTRVYQGVAGKLPEAFIARLERVAVGDNGPNLTLILDLPAEQGLARAASRRGEGEVDRFESEGLAFHETLRQAFLDIAKAEPGRCVVIDASESEDMVAAAIWSAVESRLDPAGAFKVAAS
jgi:dTMP kinase